ncbi:MAG TPA: butyrate kinase [Marinilabiliales bacterium]|jgi:butyrate kinase|nr:MAG: butyrate kinase [Bacteroidetes bacterium GWA2_40_14]OFX60342.1 MAG: butyrate kinase [Bacteroidetes bacterium GWC2_40_13]OFX76075.1 MAG: butyrate kinase [Bacteroidetes bacterium GWD2_40_43]OFX94311.1 MAG: butyrate kinase [Bacteroidetes bacterium GWE2_40_63]OFY18790.1 MAG: butyrate kinase [Bacteroidetes bacterium GWF2_40_13]OFZ24764.1 MAG: butyrate kinase [Bacteroidetes bacterium RIFOXYC2_FULL_40_12]HAM99369.1 butyrate kinase [Marinilabiliales bacterium]
MDKIKILAINPGSTSTKIAVYHNDKSVFLKTIRHATEELEGFKKITDQFEFRKEVILKELAHADIDVSQINVVIGRGGLIKPVQGGAYQVNKRMKEDLEKGIMGEHASNLGGLIAFNIAQSIPDVKALIANPVVVDELQDVARISGHPEFERVSIFHALNQKAIARQFAKSRDTKYEELNLIVAHLGGGISVGAHYRGKVIDVNNALDGDGPFSPERAGSLPAGQLVRLCYSGKYSYDEVKKMLTGKGGLMAYFGTNSSYEIEVKAKNGDEKAKLLQDAMAYQIGKAIGEMATVLYGEVHGILITGGVANNKEIISYIRNMVGFIAPVFVYPGEDEMSSLAMNALLVLRGEVELREYT